MKTFITIILLFAIGAGVFWYVYKKEAGVTITREWYTFSAPKEWIPSDPRLDGGCVLDGISNDTSDGHRMAGEIGIYTADCFSADSLASALYTEKDGYFIAAYYDLETTTAEEIAETQKVFEQVVTTFKVIQ